MFYHSAGETLLAALVWCVEKSQRSQARDFLSGLSCDELAFIAEYMGSCILESAPGRRCSRAQLARSIAEFQSRSSGGRSADQEHKMILLLEFLCRGGVQGSALNPEFSVSQF